MPATEAHIQTGRASRYLAQVCQHVTSIYAKGPALRHRRRRHLPDDVQERPEAPPRVEWSDTQARTWSG